MYDEQDHIEEAAGDSGFGRRGYRFRVLGRERIFPIHHTNCLDDAKRYFNKCRDWWVEQEEISQ